VYCIDVLLSELFLGRDPIQRRFAVEQSSLVGPEGVGDTLRAKQVLKPALPVRYLALRIPVKQHGH